MMIRALIILLGLVACHFPPAALGDELHHPALQLTTPKGDVIALYAEREPMCQGKLRATWFINFGKDKGRALRGCFLIVGTDVRLDFEGGETWVVPVAAFSRPRES